MAQQITRFSTFVVTWVILVLIHGPTQIQSGLAHGQTCNPSQNCTEKNTVCQFSTSNEWLCLCAPAFYRHQDDTCHEMTELKVSDITATAVDQSVTLTWVPASRDVSVTYSVLHYPSEGQAEVVSDSRAVVKGLNLDRLHSVVVTTTLQSDTLYGERTVQGDLKYFSFRGSFSITSIKPGNYSNWYIITVDCPLRHDSIYLNLTIGQENTFVSGHCPDFETNYHLLDIQADERHNYTLTAYVDSSQTEQIGDHRGSVRSVGVRKKFGETCTSVNYCGQTLICRPETGRCGCASGYYHDPLGSQNDFCEKRKTASSSCTPYLPDRCVEGTTCILPTPQSDNGICQCHKSTYYDGKQGCLPVSTLQVQNVRTRVLDSFVIFTWDLSPPPVSTSVQIQHWIEDQGGNYRVLATVSGGQMLGLEPDTEYNFTVETTVRHPYNIYIAENSASVAVGELRTRPRSDNLGQVETITVVTLAMVVVVLVCLIILAITVLVMYRRFERHLAQASAHPQNVRGCQNPINPQHRARNMYEISEAPMPEEGIDVGIATVPSTVPKGEGEDDHLYEEAEAGVIFKPANRQIAYEACYQNFKP